VNRVWSRMNRRFFTMAALAALCLATVLVTVSAGSAQLKNALGFESPGWSTTDPVPQTTPVLKQSVSRLCAVQPTPRRSKGKRTAPTPLVDPGEAVTLERFRGPLLAGAKVAKPPEEIALIDPSNYGDRFLKDVNGKLVPHQPIIVLHETVGSASSVVNYFRTPHPNDNDQVSYHTLIKLNGTVVYLVPPEKRAFGAGNSVFKGAKGLETVKTNVAFPPSVNNFAYHISLETPADGENNGSRHSGYTAKQYQSLAWLIARTGVPEGRITLHKIVDRSSSRMDPRSFDWPEIVQRLSSLPRSQDVIIDCVPPENLTPLDSPNSIPLKAPKAQPAKPRPASRPDKSQLELHKDIFGQVA
jgi:hypothetical protein